MRDFWNRIIHLGITEKTTYSEVLRLKLLNKICFAIALVGIGLGLCAAILLGDLERWLIMLPIIFLPVFTLVLVWQSRIRAAFYFFVFYGILMQIIVTIVLGNDDGRHHVLILFSFIAAIFIDDKKGILRASIAAVIAFFIIHIYFMHYEALITSEHPFIEGAINFIILIVMVYYLGAFYLVENHEQRTKINQYIKEVEAKNEELKNFTSVASHDMKEPLRTMSSFAGLLKRKLVKSGQAGEGEMEAIQFIQDASKRMTNLLEELLSYSVAGLKIDQTESVDLNDVLNTVRANLQHTINEVDAILEIDEQLPEINGTYNTMVQLFQNLISNGIKYQPKSSDHEEEHHTPQIKVEAKVERDQYIIAIKDNGIGIEEEYLKKVFEPFKRLHKRNEYEGTGLGLATCKKIVENIEGSISVESQPGKGSVFTLAFPKIAA